MVIQSALLHNSNATSFALRICRAALNYFLKTKHNTDVNFVRPLNKSQLCPSSPNPPLIGAHRIFFDWSKLINR